MASMTISVDDKVKRDFSTFCNEVGLSASSLINVFMVATARERRVPFTIAAPGAIYGGIDELESDIAISRSEFAEGKGIPLDEASRKALSSLRVRRSARAAL